MPLGYSLHSMVITNFKSDNYAYAIININECSEYNYKFGIYVNKQRDIPPKHDSLIKKTDNIIIVKHRNERTLKC